MAALSAPEFLDDSSSFTGTDFTTSSSSTVWGPGALTGKFLKAFGEKSLDLVVSVVIRRRLAAIKNTLEKSPHIFRNPRKASEWQRMHEMHADLNELCRKCYSLSIRRAAANLIRDIVLITSSGPGITASPTHAQWEPLLARLQRPGGVLSRPPETVISVDKRASEALHEEPTQGGHPDPHGIDDIQVGVTVEVTQSYEPRHEPPVRKASLLYPRLFKTSWPENSDDKKPQDFKVLHSQPAKPADTAPVHGITSWWPCRTQRSSPRITQFAQSIRNWIHSPRQHGTRSSVCTSRKEDANLFNAKEKQPQLKGSHPLDDSTTHARPQSHKLSSRILAPRKVSPCNTRGSATIVLVASSLSPALPAAASALPSGHDHRTMLDIRRDLARARKVVHELESDLLLASLAPQGASDRGDHTENQHSLALHRNEGDSSTFSQ